jgi:hypothetical protein
MSKGATIMSQMKYYDPVKNWRKIKPHLAKAEPVLVRDFNKFTSGRWNKEFTAGHYPEEFESCDWRWDRKGRHPQFWRYVKHAACHWLVNHGLVLAQFVMPQKSWRIVTSQRHSTVWDGNELLFDFNFLALGISADEAFLYASQGGKVLPIGQELEVHFAEHYSVESSRGVTMNGVKEAA